MSDLIIHKDKWMLSKIIRAFRDGVSIKTTLAADDHSIELPRSADFFLLEEESLMDIFSIANVISAPRWMYPTHLADSRYALVLTAGESLETSPIGVFSDTRVYLRLGGALPELGSDGLTCEVSFRLQPGP